HPPGPSLDFAPGRWVYLDSWPSERIQSQEWFAGRDHGLALAAPAPAVHQLKNIPTTGYEASGPVMWWGDIAHDQRGTDAFSLVYDSPVLEKEVTILGQ